MNHIEVLMEHKYMQNSLTQALTTLRICVSLYFLMYIVLNGINSIGLKLGMRELLHLLIRE